MSELPLPSDVRGGSAAGERARVGYASPKGTPQDKSLPEPPTFRGLVRLFVIPLLIAGGVVAIMIPIGRMAGGNLTLEQHLERLKQPGGERTMGLIGPASKQRFIDAKAVVDHMKGGLSEEQRVKLAGQLVEILEKHTKADEGDVQHMLLLALGRVWQQEPGEAAMNSEAAIQSRALVLETLKKHLTAQQPRARTAAALAMAWSRGQVESDAAIAVLAAKLNDGLEDLDVRMACAAALGAIATSSDQSAVDALNSARSDGDARNSELVWTAAVALARMGRMEAKPTVMMLLDRAELEKLRVYDRETDPQNPVFRNLNEAEQQRFLLNAMEGAKHLNDEEVRGRLERIAKEDKAVRVRTGATEILRGK